MSETFEELRALLSDQAPSQTTPLSELQKALIALRKSQEAWSDPVRFKERVQALLEVHQRFCERHDFKTGEIIRWKKGLKNRKRPLYNEPVIVVEVLGESAHDGTEDSGSQYFRERLDIVLGILNSDGDMALFHYDQRRFEPVDAPQT